MAKKGLLGYLRSFLGEKKKKPKSIELQLSSENIEDLKWRLTVLMDDKKPFLIKGYHMKDMADELRIPVYQLSAFMNQVMGMNFNDYVNRFRIRYCESLLQNNQKPRPSLKELASESGFNNRNSFADAFKKFTGQRPSDYLKNLVNRDLKQPG